MAVWVLPGFGLKIPCFKPIYCCSMSSLHSKNLREAAAEALACPDPILKVALVANLNLDCTLDCAQVLNPSPGRPARPELVPPRDVPTRAMGDPEGRGMLLHSLAHIEFNAINLALDLVVRFAGLPARFYLDWVGVAKEEAYHHQLLCSRLEALGLKYGDYPAHDGLWQMAEKTKGSLLARLALVPRLLEARGLDVSPAIQNKLLSVGDTESAEVLGIILRDEIGHVAIGNRWFNEVCNNENTEPIAAFERCLQEYAAPAPRSPFNFPARAQAGFSEQELAWLHQLEFHQHEVQRKRSAKARQVSKA